MDAEDCVFDPRRRMVKDSAERICLGHLYEERSDHDLAWLKTKVAELAAASLIPRLVPRKFAGR
jgi:hypothetical protein